MILINLFWNVIFLKHALCLFQKLFSYLTLTVKSLSQNILTLRPKLLFSKMTNPMNKSYCGFVDCQIQGHSNLPRNPTIIHWDHNTGNVRGVFFPIALLVLMLSKSSFFINCKDMLSCGSVHAIQKAMIFF